VIRRPEIVVGICDPVVATAGAHVTIAIEIGKGILRRHGHVA
jgi:hypothetical protein